MTSTTCVLAGAIALAVLFGSSLGRGGGDMTQATGQSGTATTVWTFDRLENIGGHKTTVLGQPKVVDSPLGKAVEFDGVDDALFIDNHPLAAARTFTWEAIFRPDGGEIDSGGFIWRSRIPPPAPTPTTGCSLKSGSPASRGSSTATSSPEP